MLPWLSLHQITRTNVVILIAIIKTTPPTTPPIAAPVAEGTAVPVHREVVWNEQYLRSDLPGVVGVASDKSIWMIKSKKVKKVH